MRILTFLILLMAAAAPAAAGQVDLSGSLALQSRVFAHDAAWAGQSGSAVHGAISSTTELHWRSNDGNQRASVTPFLRWDAEDEDRSLADLQEAYWAISGNGVELLIGANTVFWGVTESLHLVDIVNQTDLAGDIGRSEKLGQPMVSVALQRDWGELTTYVLPVFRERTFAGAAGRLRPPLPIDANHPLYESRDGDNHVDLALRYSHYVGAVDIGLSIFSGTSREPRLVAAADGQTLRPVYGLIDQIGVDLQYTKDAWLWKLEAFARDGVTQSFAAAVGGVEYTRYSVGNSAADLGLLLEYQHDGRNDMQPATIADNDLFVGTRLALNDVQDTAVLAGLTYDIDTGEAVISIKAERRFGEDWFAKFRVRVFTGASRTDATWWLRQDDYLEANLTRYF